MSLTLRNALGYTEAVLDEAGSLQRFYQIIDLLTDELKAELRSKEDDFDAITQDFILNAHPLTLRYSIFNGISLFPTAGEAARKRDSLAVTELAGVLEGKLQSADLRRSA